jgi:hypothetical protein
MVRNRERKKENVENERMLIPGNDRYCTETVPDAAHTFSCSNNPLA